MSAQNFLALLVHSYATEAASAECAPSSRLEYLADHIFDFTTYDSEYSEMFAKRAVEVCAAITQGKTFEYIRQGHEFEMWYLLMCNLPFFADRIEWGTSIRGAWWRHEPTTFQSCGLWEGEEQLYEPKAYDSDEWRYFMAAVVEFAGGEA